MISKSAETKLYELIKHNCLILQNIHMWNNVLKNVTSTAFLLSVQNLIYCQHRSNCLWNHISMHWLRLCYTPKNWVRLWSMWLENSKIRLTYKFRLLCLVSDQKIQRNSANSIRIFFQYLSFLKPKNQSKNCNPKRPKRIYKNKKESERKCKIGTWSFNIDICDFLIITISKISVT